MVIGAQRHHEGEAEITRGAQSWSAMVIGAQRQHEGETEVMRTAQSWALG